MSAPVYLQPGELVTIGFDQTHDLSLISERLTADEYLGASVNTGSLNLLAGARHLAAAEGRPNRRPSLDQLCLYDFPAPLGPRWFYTSRRCALVLSLLAHRPLTAAWAFPRFGIDVRSQVATLRWLIPIVGRPILQSEGPRPLMEWSLVRAAATGQAAMQKGARPLTEALPPVETLLQHREVMNTAWTSRRMRAAENDARAVAEAEFLSAPAEPRQGEFPF